MSTQTTIFIGVGVYIVIMIAVGIYAAKKTHSASEFIVAGRSLPLWLLTTTIIATWFGGGMMIGGAGAAYDDGLLGNIADPFGATVCLLLLGLFFVRIFRRLKLLTFVDFVEQQKKADGNDDHLHEVCQCNSDRVQMFKGECRYD